MGDLGLAWVKNNIVDGHCSSLFGSFNSTIIKQKDVMSTKHFIYD